MLMNRVVLRRHQGNIKESLYIDQAVVATVNHYVGPMWAFKAPQ